MTVEVNFSTRTGFSYIVIRTGSKVIETMTYEGPHEKKSDSYEVDSKKLQNNADKISDTVKNSKTLGNYEHRTGTGELMLLTKEIKESKKVESRIGKVYGSFYGGVEIDGLHEDRMLKHWKEVDRKSAAFFKGSAFGWPTDHDRTSHSVMARLLAVGLPDRLKGHVSIGVKTRWTAHDVQVYAEKIWHKMH